MTPWRRREIFNDISKNNYDYISPKLLENIKADATIKQREANYQTEIARAFDWLNENIYNLEEENKNRCKDMGIMRNKLKAFEDKYWKVLECDGCKWSWESGSGMFSSSSNCSRCKWTWFIAPRWISENIMISIDEGIKDWDKTAIVTFKENDKWRLEVLDIKSKK